MLFFRINILVALWARCLKLLKNGLRINYSIVKDNIRCFRVSFSILKLINFIKIGSLKASFVIFPLVCLIT